MNKSADSRAKVDSQYQIPVILYDADKAAQAWDDFIALVDKEADIRRERMAAYQRFLTAFTVEG